MHVAPILFLCLFFSLAACSEDEPSDALLDGEVADATSPDGGVDGAQDAKTTVDSKLCRYITDVGPMGASERVSNVELYAAEETQFLLRVAGEQEEIQFVHGGALEAPADLPVQGTLTVQPGLRNHRSALQLESGISYAAWYVEAFPGEQLHLGGEVYAEPSRLLCEAEDTCNQNNVTAVDVVHEAVRVEIGYAESTALFGDTVRISTAGAWHVPPNATCGGFQLAGLSVFAECDSESEIGKTICAAEM